jgi:hypothetical protein
MHGPKNEHSAFTVTVRSFQLFFFIGCMRLMRQARAAHAKKSHGNDPMLPVGGAAILCQSSPGPKLPAKACKCC